jgi:tRNA-splicing endonuclease subunit Sen34
MSSSIRCYIIDNHHGLIFNPESIRLLREQHRIVGCLTGTLADYPRQNNELGIPLELSVEECCLLAHRQIITLNEIRLPISECEHDRLKYVEELDREFHRQEIVNGHERINEILLKRQAILENHRRSKSELSTNDNALLLSLLSTNNAWQNCSRTLDEHERQMLLSIIVQRLKQFTIDHMFIETPMESTRSNLQLHLLTIDEFRSHLTTIEQLRCDVFADLYQRNYWISNGDKFGGDYIVYFDDPSRCHSTFIVTCVLRHEIDDDSTRMPLTHLIARCRVAVNVNKICVLASRQLSNIEYLSINWNGF